MDPQACLERYWTAVLSADWYEAAEAYEALRAWIERGGFEPTWKHPHGRSEFMRAPHRDPATRTRIEAVAPFLRSES